MMVSNKKLQSQSRERILKKEIEVSLSHEDPDWLNDDGIIFICKTCQKYYPVKLKSWSKKGSCILCMGEVLSDRPNNNKR